MQGRFKPVVSDLLRRASRTPSLAAFYEIARRRVALVVARLPAGRAKLRVLIGVLTVVVLWGSAARLNNRNALGAHAADVVDVTRGDFTATITEPGELRALESMTISAQKDLPIIYLVPEGSTVKRGDVLVRFDPGKYELALEEESAALQVAQADFRKAKKDVEAQRQKLLADIARFEAEVRVAELDLDDLKQKPLPDEVERAQMELKKAQVAYDNADAKRQVLPALVEKGFITKDTLDAAEFNYLETKTNLQVARFSLEKVVAGAPAAELEKANIRLQQATFALERAKSGMKSQLESFGANVEREKANVERARKLMETAEQKLKVRELRAPRDGLVVYARATGAQSPSEKVQLGMIPFEGQPILYLPDPSVMVVDTEVNEIDIGKVRVGGPVELTLDAYPGTVFRGSVLRIGALAKAKLTPAGAPSGLKVFDVTVQVEGKDDRLRPGLTAKVSIVVVRDENAISVPLSAVASRDGRHVVLVSRWGGTEERTVILGPSNEHRVIVRDGLEAGEHVIASALPADHS